MVSPRNLTYMQYPTANITYGGLEDKGLTVKVKDNSNPKLRWIVWKNDRENPDMQNEVYTTLQNYKLGEIFGVKFGEKEKSFTGKEGNQVTYIERTIYEILPPIASPTSSQPQTPRSVANSSYQGNSSPSNRDFDKENVGKCMSLFLQAYLQAGNTFSDAMLQVGQAKKLAEVVVYGHSQKEDIAPDIQETADQMAGEISVEDIPFN